MGVGGMPGYDLYNTSALHLPGRPAWQYARGSLIAFSRWQVKVKHARRSAKDEWQRAKQYRLGHEAPDDYDADT